MIKGSESIFHLKDEIRQASLEFCLLIFFFQNDPVRLILYINTIPQWWSLQRNCIDWVPQGHGLKLAILTYRNNTQRYNWKLNNCCGFILLGVRQHGERAIDLRKNKFSVHHLQRTWMLLRSRPRDNQIYDSLDIAYALCFILSSKQR